MLHKRPYIVVCTPFLACLFHHVQCRSQVFTNHAPAWGINSHDWDGHYGAAVSTADWNNDGWADITLGSTDGGLRSFVNLEGGGFQIVGLPWSMQSETKALIWIDLDNDGDDDLFIQEESGRCGLLRQDEGGRPQTSPTLQICHN